MQTRWITWPRSLSHGSTTALFNASPGYLLFAEGGTLFGQPFDAAKLKTDGEPFVVAQHVGRSTTFKSAISASDTGTIAYAGTLLQKGDLTWFDRTGQRLNSTG